MVMVGIGDTSPLTGVFVGYSFDSVLDLALKRFDKTLGAGTAEVKKKQEAALA